MSCPYVATYSHGRPEGNRPNPNNVCWAVGNPSWPYSQVDLEAQDHYCFSRSYGRCPRYQSAKKRGVPPAVPEERGGLFGLFKKAG